jgi:hypothetical protein
MSVYPPEPPRTPDPRDLQTHHAPELERRLLRRGLRRMSAGREVCSRCGRSPLVGERLHVFGPDETERSVCDLCLALEVGHSAAGPLRTERVHAAERPLNVRGAG